MNLLTTTIARILFAVPMAVFGVMHFMNAKAMAGIVPSFFPGDIIWVYITGAGLIAAAVSIFINKKAKIGAFYLGLMLLIFALTVHLPGVFSEATMQSSMPNFLKDTSLAGAAFALSGMLKN
ncbi:MAG: DoxX family protein [Cyclobacteriaceae bacterium]|nr:DoxX family protein [Cyclobacteriaceae bacterium]